MLKKKKIKSPYVKGTYRYNANFTPIIYEGLLRRGLSDKEVVEYLGTTYATFQFWLHKYPDFKAIKNRMSGHVNFQVEEALLKRALGYTYKEVRKELLFDTDKEGNATKKPKSVKVIETEKHVVADLTAIRMWLISKEPEEWGNILENPSITNQIAISNEMPRIVLGVPAEKAKKASIDRLNRTRMTIGSKRDKNISEKG